MPPRTKRQLPSKLCNIRCKAPILDPKLHSVLKENSLSGTTSYIFLLHVAIAIVLTNIEPPALRCRAATDKLITQAECYHDYMMTSFTLLHFAWNHANHCGGTCRQLMSQVGGNRLRWSIPI